MAKAKKVSTTVPSFTLAAICIATMAGQYPYTPVEFHTPLVTSGDVEVNPNEPGPNGELMTRATQKALDEYAIAQANEQQTKAEKPAPKVKPTFTVDDAVPIPTVSGRGRTSVFGCWSIVLCC
jgi:hypothetical protein